MSKLKVMLPPLDPNVCQICGRDHEPDQPHDRQKLQYQYWFYQENGRWPTWKDAMDHCAQSTKADWEKALKNVGEWDG